MSIEAMNPLDAELEELARQCRAHGKDSSSVGCPMMELKGDALDLDNAFECPFKFDICCRIVKKSDWDAVLING